MRLRLSLFLLCLCGMFSANAQIHFGVRQLFFMALNATSSTDLLMPPVIAELWYLFPETTAVQRHEKERAARAFEKKFGRKIEDVVIPLAVAEARDARTQELKEKRAAAQTALDAATQKTLTLTMVGEQLMQQERELRREIAVLEAEKATVIRENDSLADLYAATHTIAEEKATGVKKATEMLALEKEHIAELEKQLAKKTSAAAKAVTAELIAEHTAYAHALLKLNELYAENERLMATDDVAAYQKNRAALKTAMGAYEAAAEQFGVAEVDVQHMAKYLVAE